MNDSIRAHELLRWYATESRTEKRQEKMREEGPARIALGKLSAIKVGRGRINLQIANAAITSVPHAAFFQRVRKELVGGEVIVEIPARGIVAASPRETHLRPRSNAVPLVRVRPLFAGAVYRKRRRGDTWHFCRNCSHYPRRNYREQAKRPNVGQFCNQCRAKLAAGNCR